LPDSLYFPFVIPTVYFGITSVFSILNIPEQEMEERFSDYN
jgi:hypothetical protein